MTDTSITMLNYLTDKLGIEQAEAAKLQANLEVEKWIIYDLKQGHFFKKFNLIHDHGNPVKVKLRNLLDCM
jgi:hypothetical protein